MTSTTPKIIEIGNLSLLTNCLDSLYRYYFDHGFYIQNETEKFIREFENRCSDSYLKSLVEVHSLQVDASSKLQESIKILSEVTTPFLSKIKEMTTIVQQQIEGEEKLKEKRKYRNEKQANKTEELLKKFEESKKQIDEEFEMEKQKMKEHYLSTPTPK